MLLKAEQMSLANDILFRQIILARCVSDRQTDHTMDTSAAIANITNIFNDAV